VQTSKLPPQTQAKRFSDSLKVESLGRLPPQCIIAGIENKYGVRYSPGDNAGEKIEKSVHFHILQAITHALQHSMQSFNK